MELINFVKGEGELDSDLDKVFFMLKNMSRLKTLPRILNSDVFQRFFQLARYAKLTKEERHMYDISLKRKWDAEAVRQTQEEALQLREEERRALLEERQALEQKQQALEEKRKALEEALAEAESKAYAEKLESALEMKKDGLPIEQIAKFTKLSIEDIEKLK